MFASPQGSKSLLLTALALACALLSGCSTVSYYSQLARGEYQLLDARRPIAEVLADPKADPALKQRLQLAQTARAFASDTLKLPRNGSYTLYADLGRSSAMWNVFATPEFSLAAVTHCFPIAGCVAYRGYYSREAAQAEALRLKATGDDTAIGGVPAYSTLGWFDDPILNTMMGWNDDRLHSSIFHELAHQQLYVKGDTAFNESFATFVEQEGLRQWRTARGLPPQAGVADAREQQFTRLILAVRERLAKLYASGLPVADMRAAKQAEIARLRADYRALRDTQWQGYSGYDAWVNADINNARLLPFGLYHGWVPAFTALYSQQHKDWAGFFAAAKVLARKTPTQRQQALEQLSKSGEARVQT
ncbi:MAG: aminopeptidase [Nevskia sp.]|nr:aminopeptidase [Nevskia sp.]